MPEGDTIHKAARRLRDALAGHEIVRFEFRRDPRGSRLPAPGVRVRSVDARGKHLLIEFDDGARLHTHMQMSGAWHVYAPGERWRRPAHRARVVVEVDDGTTAVCFDAPVVELRRAGRTSPSTRAYRALERLGPDLCTPDPDLAIVLANAAAIDGRTEVAAMLRDQRIASGVGNVFVSEICWACGVHPFTPVQYLDGDTLRALYDTAHRMLVANLLTSGRRTHARGLAVYGRAGRPCPRCRNPIEHARRGEPPRSAYWCPHCQPSR